MNIMKLNILSLLIVGFGFLSCNTQRELVEKREKPELISDDFEFTEGPASDPEGNVYFTDQPNNKIHKWEVAKNTISVYMENAGRANGLYFDNQENLLAAADKDSEIWKIDSKKDVEVLVESFEGKRLNGPNDLWVAPSGGIYFTDPYYHRDYWERTEKEIKAERVYYVDPKGNISVAAEDLVQPNGIIGTPDGKKLYIADIRAGKTYSYKINSNGSLSNKELFTDSGSDGMTIDSQGNVYLTGNGVTVFDKSGKKIKHIPIPKDWTANVTFGGKNHQSLFITAQEAIFILKMKVKGVRW
ncbi:gluconolactonase [Salegentibacter sp. 24]|uniref:SMP-30/gluconolactonase/LRE family protein n=1 Tax=Salegentibacter sp. 24 TaxID=2183986 RepID=UPI00105C91B6|nr:SMP-30/gluconolactonase/LRE family protein [Salegentibacter sp. 24]TDN90361.1 gluconolactonase [Salegentibacter sp. 24]